MMVFKFRKIILLIFFISLLFQNSFSFNKAIKEPKTLKQTLNYINYQSCEPETLKTPNALSPNGDGINDSFCLNGWEACVDDFEVMIFNRFGEIIFESKQANFCWDGTFKGQVLESNIYLFVITAKTKTGIQFKKSGNITLLR